MASNNYWMKLWFDILRDPKMGMLPDRLWRRVIELFLLAGQYGEDGILPSLPEMAWQLNKSVPAIKSDLEKISETGIVEQTPDGTWLVTNFAKRNAPVDGAKRVKDFRRRERYEKGNENVTGVKRECNEALQLRYQEEQKNRLTDYQITDDQINQSTDTRDDSIFDDFGVIFQELTGSEAVINEQVKSGLSRMVESKVTPEEYRTAVLEMQEKGYAVPKVSSPETWIMNNRKAKKVSRGNPQKEAQALEYFRQLYRESKRKEMKEFHEARL